MNLINKLNKGDKIALIAPAGAVFENSLIDKSIEKINSFGYVVKLGKYIDCKLGYLAGDDSKRLQDLYEAFVDNEVKAIFCIRGGYGTIRLLDKIPYDIIEKNKKIFVGYSDITSLHSAFSYLKFPTFHGPMFNYDLYKSPDNYKIMFDFLEGKFEVLEYELIPIKGGDIDGIIVGGNLTVLCSLIGSKYLYNFDDKILFIEEINEEPYKIDRLFNQLYHSNILKKIKGIILGSFTKCDPEDISKSFNLDYIFNYLKELTDKPIYKGLESGHDFINKIIPFNIPIKIKNNKLIIKKGDVFID